MHSLNSRTAYLFKKYYNKTATSQETRELFDLLKNSSDDELTKLMREQWQNLDDQSPLFDESKSHQILSNILSIDEDQVSPDEFPSKARTWSSTYRIVSAAAAILIVVCFGLYFQPKPPLNVAKAKKVQVVTVQDAAPGGLKAVLTLSDGRQITLDSVRDGVVVNAANFKVRKSSSGQVVFTSIDRNYRNAAAPELNTISTPRGGEYQIVLSDGSKVWLNSASTIKFPGVFKGSARTIELEGEAYFEVAKNPERPFQVKSKNSEIVVIGTQFNVKAYNNDKVMKTTLVEGSIKISNSTSSHLLKPGQQAQLTGDKMKIHNNVDVEEQIAWKHGLFQFKDAPIEEVMKQAALWYDLDVSFKGKMPKKYFTGKISRSVNASEFLKMFSYTGVEFKIEDKKIVLIK